MCRIKRWYGKKDDRIILIDISGHPPKLIFSLIIFKDFTISSSKELTKVAHNNLINGFTCKFEKYSEIVALLIRLRGTEITVAEKMKQTVLNMKDLLDMDTMGDEVKTKVKL